MNFKRALIRIYMILWTILLIAGYVVLIIPGILYWILTGRDIWEEYTDIMSEIALDVYDY